jgi:hypothetical protein
VAALAPNRTRRRPTARRYATIVLAVTLAALAPPVSGSAASGSALGAPNEPKKDTKKEYDKLLKRASKLNRDYRGELITLEEAKKAATRATADADRYTREFDTARADLTRLAASSYMTGRLDTIPLISAADPAAGIRDVTVVEHLARNNDRRIQTLRTLADRSEQSRRTARTKLDQVRKEVEDLESQRDRVRKLLAKAKPEAPTRGGGSSGGGGSTGGGTGKPDGGATGKSPIIGNSMTPRMRTLMLAIDSRFGAFPAIGCLRAGDPQDHGSGRACDFMESTAGQMPSASAQANGDAVAQFVIGNASRYGVKYVIWKQRIYDMRSSGGWRAMSDRGSITQNHFDHVHVSVL